MFGFNAIDKYWYCHRWNIYNSGNYRKLFVESLVSFMKKDICRCIDQILATEIYIFYFPFSQISVTMYFFQNTPGHSVVWRRNSDYFETSWGKY